MIYKIINYLVFLLKGIFTNYFFCDHKPLAPSLSMGNKRDEVSFWKSPLFILLPPDRLDIDKLLNSIMREFPPVTGLLNTAKR